MRTQLGGSGRILQLLPPKPHGEIRGESCVRVTREAGGITRRNARSLP